MHAYVVIGVYKAISPVFAGSPTAWVLVEHSILETDFLERDSGVIGLFGMEAVCFLVKVLLLHEHYTTGWEYEQWGNLQIRAALNWFWSAASTTQVYWMELNGAEWSSLYVKLYSYFTLQGPCTLQGPPEWESCHWWAYSLWVGEAWWMYVAVAVYSKCERTRAGNIRAPLRI